MNKVTLLNMEFHFGIGFLNELLDGTGLRLDELSSQDDAVLIPRIMYFSRLYSMKRNGDDSPFGLNDIYDIIDNNGGIGGKFWNDFYLAFNQSMNKDVPVDNSKKKVKTAK